MTCNLVEAKHLGCYTEDQEDEGSPLDKDEFVVEKLIGICYGGSGRKNGIYFKVLKRYLFICT